MKEMNNKQVIFLSVLPFSSPRVSSTKRIGPHNYVILCILIGSLLGDGSMEKDGNGSRFCFFFKENMFNMYCDLIKNC